MNEDRSIARYWAISCLSEETRSLSSMDRLTRYRHAIEKVLSEYNSNINFDSVFSCTSNGKIENL